METKENIKLGHQAPRGWRINECNSIEIDGDLHYCWSHDFVYNERDERRKLYNGEPCYYTDGRFGDGAHNYFHNTMLFWQRWHPISIKAAIRRTLKTKGIPVGTLVNFNKSYHFRGKKFSNHFIFKVKKDNPIDIKYEVNMPSYSNNFEHCDRSQKLTESLRANGFIVSVRKENNNFISSMLSTAIAAKTGEQVEPKQETGEIAIAYGHGKKIGFSSKDDTLYGYYNGEESILWDEFDCFDKWSRCEEISKTIPPEEVVKILMEPNRNQDD